MKNTTYNKLIGTFEKLARAMASKHDIKVVPSNRCSTDGRTIYYPNNADMLDSASQKALHGWLDHEVGHITEEDAHKRAGRKAPMDFMKECTTSKERCMLNVFEDIRMEIKKGKELVGVAENLHESAVGAVKKWRAKTDLDTANFWHTFGCAIIFKARGLDISWLPAGYSEFMDQVQDEIAEITDPSKKLWVEDSHRLAKSVIEKVSEKAEELQKEKEEMEQEQNEQPQSDQDGEGQGQDGRGDDEQEHDGEQSETQAGSQDGEQDADAEDEGAEAGDEDGEQADGENDRPTTDDAADQGTDQGQAAGDKESDQDSGSTDGQGNAERGAARDLADQAEQDCDTDDISDSLKQEIEKAADQEAEVSGRYRATAEAKKRDKHLVANKDDSAYESAKQDVSAQIRGMKSKLTGLIRAQAEGSVINDQSEGELDPDSLYSVRLGNKRVYTQTTKGEILDTAISVLIDLSGSMGNGNRPGEPAYYARRMAIALGETFDALKVPFEIIGFNSPSSSYGYGEPADQNVRNAGIYTHHFKDFGDKYRKVRARLGTISGHNAGNIDGESVMEAAQKLAQRPESRKILFVLSDGCPRSRFTYTDVLAQNLKDTVSTVTGAGIEVFAIGAGDESVKGFYNKETGADCIVIMDISTLAKEVYRTMKGMLLNNRRGRKGRKGRR